MSLLEILMSFIRGFVVSVRINMFHKDSKIGRKLRLGKNCRIRIRKNSRIVIGNDVVLGDGVKISSLNGGNVTIGDFVGLGDYCEIVSHNKVSVGNKCNLAPHIYIFDHDHYYDENGFRRSEYVTSPIIIGKECWIGVNTTVLRGSVIGDNVIIGAGCVIKRKIESDSIVIQTRNTVTRKIQSSQK